MELKTSKSYQEEVLGKYKREEGGEMRGYLAKPTCSQIRDACVYLLHRRVEKNDEYILNRFFQFRSDDNRLREIQNFGIGKFKSIEKFLKGEIKTTSTKNINLISWLIDFKPRPYEEYRKSKSLVSKEETGPEVKVKTTTTEGRKPFRWKLIITISIAFGSVLLTKLILDPFIFVDYNPTSNGHNTNISDTPITDTHNETGPSCMTWADTLYISISCNTRPYSKYGTRVEPVDQMKLNNFKKIKVNIAYKFFTEDGKPLVWYYKTKENQIEYFTAPGFHPTNGETLKKITPYIIDKYVPLHSD